MAEVAFQWVLATVLALVSPLYAKAGRDLVKGHNVDANESDIGDNMDDIEENREAVRDIQSKVTKMEYELQVVRRDMQVIHDLVAESNHCGAEGCRWCERHDDE